jgi:hypothetical protein
MTKSLMAAVASAFAAGTLIASAVSAQTSGSPTFGDTSLACKGINACKGQSASKSATNACEGQNACKDQGWVEARSKLEG